MLTANAAKLVEKEYRRRRPSKGFPWWAVILLAPLWLCIGLIAAMSLKELFWQTPHGNQDIMLAVGGAAGLVLFSGIPLRPIYIIGHELTHWLAAKITFHKTGEIKLKWNQGYIEIIEPNGFIALAPYWVPFYFMLSACIVAFVSAFWGDALTEGAQMGSFFWLGFMYAYHICLTIRALRHGQKDLEYCGKLLSWCIIFSLNLVTAFMAFAIANPAPLKALAIPLRIVKAILYSLFSMSNCFGM